MSLCLTKGELGFEMFCQSCQNAVSRRHGLIAQHPKPEHVQNRQNKKQDFFLTMK